MRHRSILVFSLLIPAAVLAQQTPTTPQPFIEQQRQQERERALREQNERQIDERLPAPAARLVSRIPDAETPCFRIDRVLLVGDASDSFQWAVSPSVLSGTSGDDSPLGRCLGTSGVNVVLARAQAEVIARGWTTTRVLAAPQDLTTGTLTLTLVPGRIAAIRLSADSTVPLLGQGALLATAIPASPGDLLNLRAIEQGLENLKRSPTAEADIQIEPSSAPNAKPGESDLVVKYVQSKKWRLSMNLDDSGTETTGRYQGGITASLDNPLGLNDLWHQEEPAGSIADLHQHASRRAAGLQVRWSEERTRVRHRSPEHRQGRLYAHQHPPAVLPRRGWRVHQQSAAALGLTGEPKHGVDEKSVPEIAGGRVRQS